MTEENTGSSTCLMAAIFLALETRPAVATWFRGCRLNWRLRAQWPTSRRIALQKIMPFVISPVLAMRTLRQHWISRQARILPAPQAPRPQDLATMTPEQQNAFFESLSSAQRAAPRAFVPVRVTNSNIDDIAMIVTLPASLQGRVRLEPDAAVTLPSLDFLRI